MATDAAANPPPLLCVAWKAQHDPAALARIFDVSEAAMAIRLREIGLAA